MMKTMMDSTCAVLVWEPRRVVPAYAVPTEDVQADLQASDNRAARQLRIPGTACRI
jgi:hypothetical protein